MHTRALHRPTLSILFLLSALLLVPGAGSVEAQGLVAEQKAEMALEADRTSYAAGSEAQVAAVVTIEDGWHTNSHEPTYEWLIPTELTLELPDSWSGAVIVYPEGAMKTFAFTEEPISVYDGTIAIVATLPVPEDASGGDAKIRASLRYQACDHKSCLPPVSTDAEIDLTIGPAGTPQNEELFAAGAGTVSEGVAAGGRGHGDTGSSPPATTGLAGILLLALLGGLILNVMPCVLPVLSIKVFGLVKSAGEGRAHVTAGALATTAGVLVSFWALALTAVIARTAGAAVGWGTQFQHPGFVTFLLLVVVLFCLNLWGLFEIPLPGFLARVGSSGPREGLAGHFGSGLFATLMATPCSAPFLGTAIAFALAQPATTVFAIFTAIGVGMALPYLILAVAPGAARRFPKPGAWMDDVRKIMGFLLAAAAVWLLYVLAAQISPERLTVIELGVLAVALFVWMRSRAARGPLVRGAAAAGIVVALIGTLALSFNVQAGEGATAGAEAQGRITWMEFDRQEALRLAEEDGRLVFVDVTADWCITCKANERLVLATDAVADAFESHDVIPMKADWTNRNDEIGDFLADFGKAGIPFYVLYRPNREPHVFGELLTRDSVLTALRESGDTEVADLGD